jgi:hypothetical protein
MFVRTENNASHSRIVSIITAFVDEALAGLVYKDAKRIAGFRVLVRLEQVASVGIRIGVPSCRMARSPVAGFGCFGIADGHQEPVAGVVRGPADVSVREFRAHVSNAEVARGLESSSGQDNGMCFELV